MLAGDCAVFALITLSMPRMLDRRDFKNSSTGTSLVFSLLQ